MTQEHPKHATLIEALIAAQSEYPGIPKEAEGQARGGKYRYATLAAVLEAVVPALNRNGIALIQQTSFEGESLTLHTILRHTSGQEIASVIPLPQPQGWQEWGIAMTYARRYTITALAGVAPEDDEDGAGAQGAPKVDAKHGICPDHGVPYFQSGKMRSPAHKLDSGGWCNAPESPPPTDGLGWNTPPADAAPAQGTLDPRAAAQAAVSAGFGAPKMPTSHVAAPHGICELHQKPWAKTAKGQFGHYFTPNPPRGDGKGEWCPRRTPAPSLAEQAAQVAAERAGDAQATEYREV